MSQTFTATNSGSGATVFDNLLANTNTLRSSFAGASATGTEVVGQLFLHEGGAASGDDQLMVYADLDGGGDANVEIGSFLHTDLEFIGPANTAYQLINARLENRGTKPTPAAGYVGRAYFHTGEAKAYVIVSSSKSERIVSGDNTDFMRVELPLNRWTKGSTPPTDATIGTTPTVPGWLFDATGETASCAFRVPAGFSADADVKLRLVFALNVSETANDDLDITADVRVVDTDSNEALNGTSSQYTGTVDIGSNTAQYSTHEVEIDLTYNDATNPITGGDLVAVEIHLTNVTGVAEAVLIDAHALVPFGVTMME